mmetsp:Transcript_25303/g.39262  ORF Transcript_25303/g.39262 Transcript_25303/m.39262 type:complete len:928 (+) Transcript_25303:229-3012(+)
MHYSSEGIAMNNNNKMTSSSNNNNKSVRMLTMKFKVPQNIDASYATMYDEDEEEDAHYEDEIKYDDEENHNDEEEDDEEDISGENDEADITIEEASPPPPTLIEEGGTAAEEIIIDEEVEGGNELDTSSSSSSNNNNDADTEFKYVQGMPSSSESWPERVDNFNDGPRDNTKTATTSSVLPPSVLPQQQQILNQKQYAMAQFDQNENELEVIDTLIAQEQEDDIEEEEEEETVLVEGERQDGEEDEREQDEEVEEEDDGDEEEIEKEGDDEEEEGDDVEMVKEEVEEEGDEEQEEEEEEGDEEEQQQEQEEAPEGEEGENQQQQQDIEEVEAAKSNTHADVLPSALDSWCKIMRWHPNEEFTHCSNSMDIPQAAVEDETFRKMYFFQTLVECCQKFFHADECENEDVCPNLNAVEEVGEIDVERQADGELEDEVPDSEGQSEDGIDESDEDEDVAEEEEEEANEEEEEEEDQDFLSTMQFCGEASAEKPKKSLRTREKKVNYNENEESSDDMESWQDSEEEKEEKQKGKKKEEEVEDESDDASVASVRKPPATKPVVDVIETSEAPKEKMVDKAKPDEDAKMTTADSSDEDGDKKMEEEPVISAPVILHPKKADNNKVELLLSGMSHLPPDTKIEVFNRKTGLVMRGDEAILLKDLPAALLNHADYEPIVPTPQSATVGEADDKEAVAEELPVDPNFDPWDTSVLVGVTVVVKSGPYRGITAKIKEVRGSRWVLDHEAVTTTLRSSDCHFIDDGEADKDAIAAHYRTKKKVSMPSFVKHGVINVSGNRAIAAAAASVRRVGRTDSDVRVSNVVIPQTRPHTRVRASAVEGKRVLVTGGEFRGLSGTISSCIPGGWYLVSNLYDDDHELDVLINSERLKLMDGVSSKTSYMQGRIQEQIKSRIYSKASELRMEKKRKDDQHQAKMRSI